LTAAASQPRRKATTKPTPPPPISPEDPVTAWAAAVVAGQVIAGPHIRNAARRHLADLRHGPARGLTWDLAAAKHRINFFPDVLRLAQRFDGQPFNLHPSQQFIVGSLFGWKKADGARRFRRAYIEQGKGNGKSPLAAGIGMSMLLADGEAQAEVYAGASMKSQAMVLFRDAVAMWRQSPAIAARLTPSGGNPIWNLADLRTGSFFRPISTDEAHSGPRPSCALLDEIHEHRDGNMIEMMERGFKSRRQPLLIMITNSGSDRASVCWQEHQHAIKVAAGTREIDAEATFVGEPIDDTTFSFVCGLDVGDDPLEDPACWVKANPLLGITMPAEELERAVKQAKAIPGKLNNILRLHFCQWTDSDTAWMSRPALEAVLADFDPADHSGAPVYVGLDLSATRDLTAMAFVVPTGTRADGQPTFDAWVEAWTPGDTVGERALRDQVPYDLWVREGWLEAPAGKLVSFAYVAARLAETVGVYEIQALAFDTYGFNKHFEPELDSLGLTLPIVEHPQGGKKKGATGLWMPGSKLTLEALILEGRIRLRRSPVLISAMMGAATEADPFGNTWFSKRKATLRIDALVALAMAVGAASSVAPVEASFWESEDAELV
jgi:phage terminase large subunit-like protein